MWRHRQKRAIHKQERGPRGNQTCPHLDISFAASRTVRRCISVVKSPGLWYFVTAALAKSYSVVCLPWQAHLYSLLVSIFTVNPKGLNRHMTQRVASPLFCSAQNRPHIFACIHNTAWFSKGCEFQGQEAYCDSIDQVIYHILTYKNILTPYKVPRRQWNRMPGAGVVNC